MLESLKNNFRVITIRVEANNDLALERVRTRDQSIHINVSDQQVNEINAAVRKRNFVADYTLVNENKSREELLCELQNLLRDGLR